MGVDDNVLREEFGYWGSKLEEGLKSIIPNPLGENQTTYQWLYSFEDLTIHEENKEIRSIWIYYGRCRKTRH